jgi:hypothetical protein
LAAETLNSSWQGPKRSDMSSWGRRQARVAAVCCLTPLVVMGPASCPAAALISGGRLVVGGWTRGKRACQEDGSCGLQTAQHCVQGVLCQRDKHTEPLLASCCYQSAAHLLHWQIHGCPCRRQMWGAAQGKP